MKIQIVIFDGFDELDAIAPFEVLTHARIVGADIQVQLVTLDDVAQVTGANGVSVRSQGRLSLNDKLDVLIVPGGNWGNHAPQGTWAEVQRGDLPNAISQLHRAGTLIAGVCTGGMVIAAAGLLAGRPAITHHLAIEDLRIAGAEVISARVVDDGDIITAGGVTSGLDLALWVVERCADAETALKVEKRMEYERRGTVWKRATC